MENSRGVVRIPGGMPKLEFVELQGVMIKLTGIPGLSHILYMEGKLFLEKAQTNSKKN